MRGRRDSLTDSVRPGPGARVEALEPRLLLSGFTAYNDTVAGALTHPNTTAYADNGGDAAGQLKDIATGANNTPYSMPHLMLKRYQRAVV